jgi:hypothetical protein
MSLSDENAKKIQAAIDALENILTELVHVPADYRATDALEIAMSLLEQQIIDKTEYNVEPPPDVADDPLEIVDEDPDQENLEQMEFDIVPLAQIDVPHETIQHDIFNEANFLFLTKEDMGGIPGVDDLQNWFDSSPDK